MHAHELGPRQPPHLVDTVAGHIAEGADVAFGIEVEVGTAAVQLVGAGRDQADDLSELAVENRLAQGDEGRIAPGGVVHRQPDATGFDRPRDPAPLLAGAAERLVEEQMHTGRGAGFDDFQLLVVAPALQDHVGPGRRDARSDSIILCCIIILYCYYYYYYYLIILYTNTLYRVND